MKRVFLYSPIITLLLAALLMLSGCAQPPQPQLAEPQQQTEPVEEPADALARELAAQQERQKKVADAIEAARVAENTGETIAGTAEDPEKPAQVLEKVEGAEKARQQAEQELSQAATTREYTFDRASGTITGYNGAGDDLVIPAQIGGVAVKHIGEAAFQSRDSITSVVIPEGVVSIGDWAFNDSIQIASITVPKSVKSIGEGAFLRTAITGIDLPQDLQTISPGLFSLCGRLSSITIPASVTSIGNGAFAQCSALSNIAIPPGVKSIGSWAFQSCDALTEVVIPQGVESIGELAFERCRNLNSIYIPASVKSIGGGIVFWSGEVTIMLDSANLYYVMEDGVLFNAARTELIYCSTSKSGDYNIPEGVTKIGDYAFGGCSQLSSLTIPASVSSIGDYVFISCGASEVTFAGERPAFTGAFEGAFAVEHIYYQEGAAGWPGEPTLTSREVIVPEPKR